MDKYQLTFDTWNQLAEVYQANFMELKLYDDTYSFFCNQLTEPNSKILEIGCGPGNITRYLINRNICWHIDAIDVSPNMIEIAQKNNPKANFWVMDCREIYKLNNKYNAIISGFCLPYLEKNEVKKIIGNCSNLLTNEGIFYLSTILGDYDKSGLQISSDGKFNTYVYYYEEAILTEYLKNHKFENLKTFKIAYTNANGEKSIHLVSINKKTA